jgi:ribonuclease BN (tRNA processing enzyme)
MHTQSVESPAAVVDLHCCAGDTRPCAALAAAGAGATLLIHEATFEAGLAHHARAKGHSTLQEALQVAQDMGAYR